MGTTRPVVACLCCTSRPEWMAWLKHQYEKQTWNQKELLIEDGPGLIPEKRTKLIQRARNAGFRYIAWFDDDDWQSPTRLRDGVITLAPLGPAEYRERPPAAVGNVRSHMVNVDTRLGITYQAPEGIIFNGAVFELTRCPETFSRALPSGEDTDWLARWHRRKPTYIVLGQTMQMWLCHRTNITNRCDVRSYAESVPKLITEDEWKLVPR